MAHGHAQFLNTRNYLWNEAVPASFVHGSVSSSVINSEAIPDLKRLTEY